MNESTIFLAKIIGPTLFILGLGIVFNPKFYLRVYKNLKNESLIFMMLAMAIIVLGVVMLNKHFTWGSPLESLISLIGLALTGKGIFLAIAPRTFKRLSSLIVSKNLLLFGGILWIIGGAYLIWFAYFL